MIILRSRLFSFNSDFPDTIKINNILKLKKSEVGFVGRLLGRISKKMKEKQNNFVCYSLILNQEEIGNIQFCKNSDTEIYGNWLQIDDKYRGKGYATETLRTLISIFRKMGFSEMTLEVPDNSPDARHIYNKLGFKEVEYLGTDLIWGGLTKMKLKL